MTLESILSIQGSNDFRLAALHDGCYDLSSLCLELQCRLVDEEGKPPGQDAEVAPECGLLHNLISEVQVNTYWQVLTGLDCAMSFCACRL